MTLTYAYGVITEKLVSYFQHNLGEEGNLIDAEGLRAAAKGGVLREYLEGQFEEMWESEPAQELLDETDALFLLRALWFAVHDKINYVRLTEGILEVPESVED